MGLHINAKTVLRDPDISGSPHQFEGGLMGPSNFMDLYLNLNDFPGPRGP